MRINTKRVDVSNKMLFHTKCNYEKEWNVSEQHNNKINLKNTTSSLDNEGFTLVEILVSILILAIIATPLLKHFVTSYRVNAKSEKMQQETLLAQNILEDVKASTLYELFDEYKDNSGQLDIPNEIYYLAKKDIVYNNKNYDVLITLDATLYKEEVSADPSGAQIGYNTFQMPIIADINTPKNILAMESYETELAVAALYSNHINYISEQRELYKDEPDYSILESSALEIRDRLTKQININISRDRSSSELMVNIAFEFSCTAIKGCRNEKYMIADKRITSPIGDVYVFYYPTYHDSIFITKDIIIEDVDIFVVRQEPKASVTSIPETILGSLPLGVNLHSNVSFGVNSKPLVKKDTVKNRIYDVTVRIYKAGSNFSTEGLCVEFHSTKEE